MKQKKEETLATRLRDCRVSRGLTQEYAAKVIGLQSRATIAKYEAGRVPSEERIDQLSVLYHVSTDYLLHGHRNCTESQKPPDNVFRIHGRPRGRNSVQLYPRTVAVLRKLAGDNGISVAEVADQIVRYALQNTDDNQGGIR